MGFNCLTHTLSKQENQAEQSKLGQLEAKQIKQAGGEAKQTKSGQLKSELGSCLFQSKASFKLEVGGIVHARCIMDLLDIWNWICLLELGI